ncbi:MULTISPECIES: acyltransferase family protein [unclassified Streptomyces]|uniref:acyltransferase family protein n=1 Tax=unclassified Streptomyces TaxID=2593676 RepID=UPI001F034026|nr:MULTISPECIES: acyltransferase family protein [unclassified Streptomyces]MCH0566741.1 acyltransferase family protein [Streptomyces sp. MUM 2J]MCH0569996.1 acyltransferase family protein [Streptomyces sp. MUM 136J]
MFHAAPSPETPQQRQNTPAPTVSRPRDAFFDNAKFLTIVLVAVGHAWEPLKGDSRALEAAYRVVYAFHMPAFVIISGYFSRSFDMRPDRLRRLVTSVVVPYVLFEVAYTYFRRVVGHLHDQPISLLDPWYLTWFLCALFVWRLTSPLWRLVRLPLLVALGLAMLASASPGIGNDLDLQRVLQFLPYFVLGLCLRPEHFRWVRRRAVRVLSVPVFAGSLAVAWWSVPRVDASWLYHSDSAQELHAAWWAGPVMVLVLFGCAVLLTACFLSWSPGRRLWCTALGAGTLYGYLLHGFLAKGSDYAGWYDHAWLHGPAGEILVTVLAATAVTLLCTPPVQRVFRFAMEPRMAWAFRRDGAGPTRVRERSGRSPAREPEAARL